MHTVPLTRALVNIDGLTDAIVRAIDLHRQERSDHRKRELELGDWAASCARDLANDIARVAGDTPSDDSGVTPWPNELYVRIARAVPDTGRHYATDSLTLAWHSSTRGWRDLEITRLWARRSDLRGREYGDHIISCSAVWLTPLGPLSTAIW